MFRKKKVQVRILDVPRKLVIDSTFIAVPLADGRELILHGNFENIPDAEAYRLAQNAVDKFAVA